MIVGHPYRGLRPGFSLLLLARERTWSRPAGAWLESGDALSSSGGENAGLDWMRSSSWRGLESIVNKRRDVF
jgi:hypothetical protein